MSEEEVGPELDTEPLSEEQTLRGLRRLKSKKVALTEFARQIGYSPLTVKKIMDGEHASLKFRQRASWLLRALLDGKLMVVKANRGGGQVFLPTAKALEMQEVRARLERCVCGRYTRCPCAAHKPTWVNPWRVPSRSGAAKKDAVGSTALLQPSPSARTAAPLGASGYLSGLRFQKSPPK